MGYSLKDITSHIGIECSKDIEISNLSTLKESDSNSLSFFHNSKYLDDLKETKAAAVILEDKYLKYLPKESIAIISENPYSSMAKVTELFAYKPTVERFEPELEEGAQISDSVECAKSVKVGKGSTIMANCYLGEGVVIGENTTIYPNVTIYHGTKIGSNCIIHSGAVIGSDGFGFVSKDNSNIKFHQIGNVVIENFVEIGANTTIDRATLGSTIIKSYAKLDNLIQVGHNCEIGEYSIIVSQVGLSGSTKLGMGVVMGGQSATAGHLSIGDKAMIAARGGVTKSLEGGKIYGGFPAIDIKLWRKTQVALMRLVKAKKR